MSVKPKFGYNYAINEFEKSFYEHSDFSSYYNGTLFLNERDDPLILIKNGKEFGFLVILYQGVNVDKLHHSHFSMLNSDGYVGYPLTLAPQGTCVTITQTLE